MVNSSFILSSCNNGYYYGYYPRLNTKPGREPDGGATGKLADQLSVCSLRKVFRTGLLDEMSLEQTSENREVVTHDGHLVKLV